jgi:hypothetical protein
MASASSPWYSTPIINNQYLNVLNIRTVPASDDDALYEVQEQYTHRPDLLAYDLYNDYRLWWVFAQRNMDIIRDPVYDLEAGIEIYLPKADKLRQFLGL